MELKKIADSDVSFRRWPRTLNEAFGPMAKLHVEPEKTPLRAYVWMVAYGVAIGAGFYVLVALKSGAL
ncbi:hypothetical protein [Paraburkholderia saeva]|uniref:hypothetical protein n=1 Tax=Paraburkholderia saeva TaxID=2777537 RepID=UPI001D3864B2|nr:hypothetical protein [Paraburkholderia saeva]CAG4887799.1 hypothetical protein R52603_00514 [Paraburkholderia saeva]